MHMPFISRIRRVVGAVSLSLVDGIIIDGVIFVEDGWAKAVASPNPTMHPPFPSLREIHHHYRFSMTMIM